MVVSKPWPEVEASVSTLRILAWKSRTDPDRPAAHLFSLVEPLDEDQRTKHFIFERQGEIVGAARLTIGFLPESILSRVNCVSVGDCALFSRLVVQPDYRRRGVAHALDLARIDEVKREQKSSIWAEAAPWRVNAMKLLGFESILQYTESDATFVNLTVTVMHLRLPGEDINARHSSSDPSSF